MRATKMLLFVWPLLKYLISISLCRPVYGKRIKPVTLKSQHFYPETHASFICLFSAENVPYANFTTNPPDVEVFVGENTTLTWEYEENPIGAVKNVMFGVYHSKDKKEAIIVKAPSTGISKVNPNLPLGVRLSSPSDRSASFQITDVKLNDSDNYYCLISLGKEEPGYVDPLKLTVVGE